MLVNLVLNLCHQRRRKLYISLTNTPLVALMFTRLFELLLFEPAQITEKYTKVEVA